MILQETCQEASEAELSDGVLCSLYPKKILPVQPAHQISQAVEVPTTSCGKRIRGGDIRKAGVSEPLFPPSQSPA